MSELSRSELSGLIDHYAKCWQMQRAIIDLFQHTTVDDHTQFAADILSTAKEAQKLFADRRDAFKAEFDRRFPTTIRGFG